jgi:hypothetical protein
MMACARSETCNLAKMFETWLPTVLAEVEAVGGLGVGLILGDGGEDPVLTLGELGESISWRARMRSGEIAHQAFGERGADDRLAAREGPDRPQYLCLQSTLEQAAPRPGLQCGEDRLVILEHADDEDADVRLVRRIRGVASMPFTPTC